jgi:hypothetical protein
MNSVTRTPQRPAAFSPCLTTGLALHLCKIRTACKVSAQTDTAKSSIGFASSLQINMEHFGTDGPEEHLIFR